MRRDDLYKRTRSCPVTCLSFGKNRKEDFPEYFFCHGCDLLENAVENNIKRANRNQKKYMCTGGHVDMTHPTTLKSQYRPNNNRPKKDSSGCASAFLANDNDDEIKESKSPSKSPVKKKTRRPSVMFSTIDAVTDKNEDGEETNQPVCDPRRLFANKSSPFLQMGPPRVQWNGKARSLWRVQQTFGQIECRRPCPSRLCHANNRNLIALLCSIHQKQCTSRGRQRNMTSKIRQVYAQVNCRESPRPRHRTNLRLLQASTL